MLCYNHLECMPLLNKADASLLFEPIIAVSHEPVLILDDSLKILSVNKPFSEKFNLNKKEILGQRLFDVGNGAFNIPSLIRLLKPTDGKINAIENYELSHDFPNIGKRIILLNLHELTAENAGLIVLSLKDISEARDIRTNELATSRTFLQSLLNTSNYGIASYDAVRNEKKQIVDFRIIYTNPEVPRNFGLEPEDVIGKLCSEVYPGIFENGVFEKMVVCMETGKPEKYETVATFNNKKVWLSASIEKLNDGVAITSKNITEEKQAALKLEAMNVELEKQNIELASFAYISSHDLQEPLRKIQMFSSRILEKEKQNFSESSQAYFSSIINAANRMQNLIESLLNYSSMDASEIKFKTLDLNVIVDDIKNNITDIIEVKNARIVAENLPKVKAIPVQFQQLLSNLISNGLKYSRPEEPPVITITANKVVLEEFDKKEFCRIDVADNGIGFKQEYETQIFELFKRLHGKMDYEGTGIGLAICKKIAQKHGGFIKAVGTPNEGSVFSVYLPIRK